MSNADLDERLREIVVNLTDQAPDPLPFPADRLGADAAGVIVDFSDDRQVFGAGQHRAIVLMGVVAAVVLAVVLVLAVGTDSLDDVIFTDDLEQPQPEPVDENEQPGPEEADDAEAFDPGSALQWVRLTDAQTGGGGAERVPREGKFEGLVSVTVGGPGFVAVGVSDQRDAFVWTSVDGATWTEVTHDHISDMISVTAGGPGLVAVGSGVWTSADGTAWTRLPHNDVLGYTGMTSVTAGGPGLVAVGSGESGAAVWTSRDGTSWTRADVEAPVLLHSEDVFATHTIMESVTTGGPGLVAVGQDWTRGNHAAVWISSDGTSWTRVHHDEDVFADAAMRSVTKGGPGLVAVGYARGRSTDLMDRQAVVWTSIDGTSWTRVPHDEDVFGKSTMRTVTAGGPGLVAVGYAWDSGSITVWTSIDGTSWTRLPHDEDVFGRGAVSSVAAAGPIVVAVGSRNNVPAIWLASPQG